MWLHICICSPAAAGWRPTVPQGGLNVEIGFQSFTQRICPLDPHTYLQLLFHLRSPTVVAEEARESEVSGIHVGDQTNHADTSV